MCKWKLVPIYYCVRKDRCECDSRVSRTTSDVSPICMCAVLPCWCYRGATNTSCNLFLLTVQKELLQKHKSLAIRSITKIPGLLVLRANSSIWFTFFTLFHYTFFYLTESLKQYLICDILYTPRLTEKKTKLNHAVVHNTSYICFNLNLLKKKLIQTVIYSKLLKQPNCSLLEIKKHMPGCYTMDMHNDRVIWLMSPQRLIWNRTQISWFFIRFFFQCLEFSKPYGREGQESYDTIKFPRQEHKPSNWIRTASLELVKQTSAMHGNGSTGLHGWLWTAF